MIKKCILLISFMIISIFSFADVIVVGKAHVTQGDAGTTVVRCKGKKEVCMRISDRMAAGSVEVMVYKNERESLRFEADDYTFREGVEDDGEEFSEYVFRNSK